MKRYVALASSSFARKTLPTSQQQQRSLLYPRLEALERARRDLSTAVRMSAKLVCLGNPLLDLQVDVEPAYLEKYDLKPNDAILVEDKKHMPIFEEALSNPTLKLVAGGAAQNTARGAQYVLPPGSVAYFGSVGNDEYSKLLLKANAAAGVQSLYQFQPDHQTGKCAALITDHDRSLVTDLAAANHFTAEHLKKPENWSVVEAAQVFYIGGFHLTVSPEAIEVLGKHAAATNKPFVINLSAPFIPEFFKEPLDTTVTYADYVIGNETEAEAYGKSHGVASKELKDIATYIAKEPKVNTKRPRTVIITHGLEPTVVVQYDRQTGSLTAKEFPVHPLDKAKIVDTNGAGDAFAGGFVAGLVNNDSLETAIDKGQWLAKLSIQEVGPSYPETKLVYPN